MKVGKLRSAMRAERRVGRLALNLNVIGSKQGCRCRRHRWSLRLNHGGGNDQEDQDGKRFHFLSVQFEPVRSVLSDPRCIAASILLGKGDIQSRVTSRATA